MMCANPDKYGFPSLRFHKVYQEMDESSEELPDFSLGIESSPNPQYVKIAINQNPSPSL